MNARWIGLAVLTLVCSVAAETEPGTRAETVEVEARVFGLGKTPEEGRREALQRAREMAVAQVGGIHVASRQTRLRSDGSGEPVDSFASWITTSTFGRIVREEVAYQVEIVDGTPVYRARLRAEVVPETGKPDPGFTLDISTDPDSAVLRDGERIAIEITASRACYLTLLNVLSDGSVAVVFPTQRDADNRLAAGETRRWPSRASGVELQARLIPGRRSSHEQIVAIATRDPVPLVLEGAEEGGSERDPAGRKTDFTALNRWLVGIPVDMRAEAMISYEIVK